jgi:predicted RNA-binding Zn-ribbon protein involved in translation (DUF1610 family)
MMEDYLRKKSTIELKALCNAFDLPIFTSPKNMIKVLIQGLQTTSSLDLILKIFPTKVINELLSRDFQICTCCKGTFLAGGHIKCSQCNSMQHIRCITDNSRIKPYYCPDCILKKISPFEPVTDILVPATKFTEEIRENSKVYNSEINYELPERLYSKIKAGNGSVQIQARCIKMDGKSINQVWPPNGFLIINDKLAMKFLCPNKTNQKMRRDAPLNVTKIINVGNNSVSLIVSNDPNTYFLSLVMIQKKSERDFINEVKEKNGISSEESVDFFKNILRNESPDVESFSYPLPLTCPISMTFISHPVRGVNCRHIWCFDLETFVHLQNTRTNSWKCPKCPNYVYDLVYDHYIKDILEAAASENNKGPAEIFPDGTFKLNEAATLSISYSLPIKRELNTQADPAKIIKEKEIICIDSD